MHNRKLSIEVPHCPLGLVEKEKPAFESVLKMDLFEYLNSRHVASDTLKLKTYCPNCLNSVRVGH